MGGSQVEVAVNLVHYQNKLVAFEISIDPDGYFLLDSKQVDKISRTWSLTTATVDVGEQV